MRKNTGVVLSAIAAAAVLYILRGSSAFADIDADKATRETDRLQRERLQDKMLERPVSPSEPFTIKPREHIPVKEETPFFVKKILLKGCESLKPEDFSPLVAKYENTETTLSELNKLADAIEQEYLRRGIIAAALVPEQEINEQTVNIQVVEARMGELKVQEQRYFNKERLRHYWHVLQGEIMRYDRMSTSVQLMNKNPDREVKAALKAGEKPGTTDVILTTETQFPLHSFYSLDNDGTPETGKYRRGIGLRHNNFLGLDDILLGGYSFGEDFNGRYLYHNLPVSGSGLNLVYGYSVSESRPKRDYSEYGISSEAETSSIALHQDLYKNGEYTGEVYSGFDAKDKTTKMITGTTNRDRLRILTVGGTHLFKGLGGAAAFTHDLSQGLPWFGASDEDNPLASRNANPYFTKLSLGANYRKTFSSGIQGSLKCKSQVASTKLASQEELSLGGIDSVRGYPAGDFLADHALQTNAEFLLPAVCIPEQWRIPGEKQPLRDKVNLVLFSDYGWGDKKGICPGEMNSINMWSTGFGWRIKLFDQVAVRLEWGFPLGNDPVTRPAHSIFHFSVDIQEKILSQIHKSGDDRKKAPKGT